MNISEIIINKKKGGWNLGYFFRGINNYCFVINCCYWKNEFVEEYWNLVDIKGIIWLLYLMIIILIWWI